MKLALNQIFEVRANDPEVARKARFLNICVFAVGTAALILVLISALGILISNDLLARLLIAYEALAFVGSLVIYGLQPPGRPFTSF